MDASPKISNSVFQQQIIFPAQCSSSLDVGPCCARGRSSLGGLPVNEPPRGDLPSHWILPSYEKAVCSRALVVSPAVAVTSAQFHHEFYYVPSPVALKALEFCSSREAEGRKREVGTLLQCRLFASDGYAMAYFMRGSLHCNSSCSNLDTDFPFFGRILEKQSAVRPSVHLFATSELL